MLEFADANVVKDKNAKTASAILKEFLSILGIEFKESKDQAGSTVEYLGILIKFMSNGDIILAITQSRRLSLLKKMTEIIDSGLLTPADALSMAGKLVFATTTCWGRFGRCMITPFYWRGHAPVNTNRITNKIR